MESGPWRFPRKQTSGVGPDHALDADVGGFRKPTKAAFRTVSAIEDLHS
jgi:hypothetical protein